MRKRNSIVLTVVVILMAAYTLHKMLPYAAIHLGTKELSFVTIPSGSFQMGDLQGDGSENELPVHTVTITGFQMSSYEIPQHLYESVMGDNPSEYKGKNAPVEKVSWVNAVRFCNRLSDAHGFERCYEESTWVCDFTRNGYRLPTEAEWEYACRAGTETRFYSGNGDDLAEHDNISKDLKGVGRQWSTTPIAVGSLKPNAWGLYDMHGNVLEWCNDFSNAKYYSNSPADNPRGPETGVRRAARGGGYILPAWTCRASFRWSGEESTYAFKALGFRIVKKLSL